MASSVFRVTRALRPPGGPVSSATFSVLSTLRSVEPSVTKVVNAQVDKNKPEKKMSSAMRLYLERKRQHDMFITREQAEFDIGKQHLANMMGMDSNTLTQEDIDKSIEYLFPSGLAPEARPVMKPPVEIFPRQKEAEFDYDGRPYQTFFYTLKPDFLSRIYTLRDNIQAISTFGDRLQSQGKRPDPEQVLNAGQLADSRWMTKEELESLTLEGLSDEDYKDFLNVLERLLSLPYSYRAREEIFKYRVTEEASVSDQTFLTPEYDEQGRAFVKVKGQRKTSIAEVKISKPGTGQVTIRHRDSLDYYQDITYFFALKDRHQLLYPLLFSKMLGLVDLDIIVEGGGPSGQAGACRYAIAMGLRSFLDQATIEDMKLSGLLTQDIRVRERKKYGKAGARKSYTWKRR